MFRLLCWSQVGRHKIERKPQTCPPRQQTRVPVACVAFLLTYSGRLAHSARLADTANRLNPTVNYISATNLCCRSRGHTSVSSLRGFWREIGSPWWGEGCCLKRVKCVGVLALFGSAANLVFPRQANVSTQKYPSEIAASESHIGRILETSKKYICVNSQPFCFVSLAV